MRSRRRILLIALVLVSLALLAVAPAAFASAGGGSAGFSDGGGGGGFGGGGGGGGNGFALFIIFRVLLDIAILGHGLGLLVLLALAAAWWFMTRGFPKMQRNWEARSRQGRAHKRETKVRQRRVELAAAEAADENPIFGPEAVRTAAAQLFDEIQLAWSSDDRIALRGLITPSLLAEWERRLDDYRAQGLAQRRRARGLGEGRLRRHPAA